MNRYKHSYLPFLLLPLLLLPVLPVPALANAEKASHECLIEPHTTIDLGTQVQGVIDQVLVREGDRVQAGQPVVTLMDSVERANFNQARDRARMTSEVSARQADLALAAQKLARTEELLTQKLVPQQEYDEVRTEHEVAEASLWHARDNARIADHEFIRFKALLEQRTVTSPIDGVVLRQHRQAGELVTDTPVLTVARLDELRVRAIFQAEWLGHFKPGDPATVHPETHPDQSFDAVVHTIDPVLDPASGTFGVQLLMNNQDAAVVAGQECTLRFIQPLEQTSDAASATRD